MDMKTNKLISLALAGLMVISLPAAAASQPTDPIGGKPPAGSKVSVKIWITR